jgi:hypothetical protein
VNKKRARKLRQSGERDAGNAPQRGTIRSGSGELSHPLDRCEKEVCERSRILVGPELASPLRRSQSRLEDRLHFGLIPSHERRNVPIVAIALEVCAQ